jgi:hypothetical protein
MKQRRLHPPRVAFWALVRLYAALAANRCPAASFPVSSFPGIIAACHTARPGDEIVLAKGVYKITGASRIEINNRPGPITLRGGTGRPEDVVIEGDGQDARSVHVVFDLSDSPGWTFENLSTKKTYFHGFKFNGNSTNCVLRNVVMRDHGESGLKGTSDPKRGVYPDHLLVEGCDIGFSKSSGGTRDVVEGIDGVGVVGWIIRSNRFLNVLRQGQPATGVFTKGNSSDTIIEGNRFENCFVGASFGGGGTGQPYFRDHYTRVEHRRGVIRYNTFINCTDAAIYLNKAEEATIENNQLFHCVLSIQLRYPESSAWVRNNVIVPAPQNPGEPPVRLRDGARLLSGETH